MAGTVNLIDWIALPGGTRASFGDIARDFDELFADAEEFSRLEALSLHTVFRERGIREVLDCSAGTGLQALGLARLGYRVAASDVSVAMTAVLKAKACRAHLAIEVRRADFRDLAAWRGRYFDAVVSGGNSLAIVNGVPDIRRALSAMTGCARPGALVVVGGRDYGVSRARGETMLPRRLRFVRGEPEWVFDLRLFGRRRVRVVHVFLRATRRRWRQRAYAKSYLYLSAAELARHMRRAGLRRVRLRDLTGLHPYGGGEWYLAVGQVPGGTR